jgi:multiple sugar transport system substrate-binding protein
MKKRIVCLLLCAMMALAFTSCSSTSAPSSTTPPASTTATAAPQASSASSDQPAATATANLNQFSSSNSKEVVFWNLWSGGDGAVLKKIVDKFNSTNADGIKIIPLTQDWGQYYTKLRTAVLGNQSPDLAMSHVTRVLELQTDGVIIPIDDALKTAGINVDFSNYTSDVLPNCQIDGKYYALPVDNLILVMHYNKKVLADCGLIGADGKFTMPEGYDNFKAMLETIKGKGYIPLLAGQKGFSTSLIWYTLYEQMGGTDIISKDLKKLTYDTDLATKAAAAEKELYTYMPPAVEDNGKLFAQGKTAFVIDGSWSMSNYAGLLGNDYGVASFPKLYANYKIWTDSHSFVLPNKPDRSAEKTKYAMEFVKWFSDNNYMWSEAGHLPAYKPSWDSAEFKANINVANYAPSSAYGVSFPSTTNVWFTFASELSDPFEKMINNGGSAKECIDTITQNVNNALAK